MTTGYSGKHATYDLKAMPKASAVESNDREWPSPVAMHWLADFREGTPRRTSDARGCVLYFATQADCSKFMNLMEREYSQRG